jgi:protein TonB
MKYLIKALLVYSFFLISTSLLAQQKMDTIFYNQNWKVTKVKDSVAFYRLTTNINGKYNVKDYYLNKTLQMTGTYASIEKEIRDGYFKYYDEYGKISSEGLFKKNWRNGIWKEYKKNKLWTETNYVNDTMHGNFVVYYPNGTLKRNEIYRKGVFINGLCYAQNGNDTIYFPFEILPEFRGGEEEMMKSFSYHMEYPKAAMDSKIEGKVIVRFCVDYDGSIKDSTIISNTPEILNQSVLKCLKKIPKWNPGKIDGEPIRVYFTLPFEFKLDK